MLWRGTGCRFAGGGRQGYTLPRIWRRSERSFGPGRVARPLGVFFWNRGHDTMQVHHLCRGVRGAYVTMANAKIEVVGPGELGLISSLYNDVFTPPTEEAFFARRFRGRMNVSMLVAIVERQHVGFIIGFELMPSTYFCWLCGVVPDFRRAGIATQLMQGQQAWARDHDYALMRFECQNQHRPMMHAAITEGYDLVGIRWDSVTANNMVIFEKELS